MGCDIYNNTVLIINHTENNITLDEIIVLEEEKIYLYGMQYEEDNVGVDFLDKYHFLSFHKHDDALFIYKDKKYQCTGYKEKYLSMIEKRISDNIEYNYYEFPLDYNDDGTNFVNNYHLTDIKSINTICIDYIKRWRP